MYFAVMFAFICRLGDEIVFENDQTEWQRQRGNIFVESQKRLPSRRKQYCRFRVYPKKIIFNTLHLTKCSEHFL